MAAIRSPRYPNISFPDAIGKARQIYEKEHMSPMIPKVAAEAMGYSGINGASLKTISSLRKYGLLEGRGDDVRLTKDAQTLIIDLPDSPDYIEAVNKNAMAPEIFGEIRRQFSGLASARNISVYLEKRGFKPSAAALVSKYYIDALALIKEPAGTSSSEPQVDSGELSIEVPPAHLQIAGRAPAVHSGSGSSIQHASSLNLIGTEKAPYRVVMNGNRLEISAVVDLPSLRKLQLILKQYESILEMTEEPNPFE